MKMIRMIRLHLPSLLPCVSDDHLKHDGIHQKKSLDLDLGRDLDRPRDYVHCHGHHIHSLH